MIKRVDGGITIKLPEDLKDLKSCIDYINLSKSDYILVESKGQEIKYNLSFLNDISSYKLIKKLSLYGNFTCYDTIYKLTELEELSVSLNEANIIDLVNFPKLKLLSTDKLICFKNLNIPKIEKLIYGNVCGEYRVEPDLLRQITNLKNLILYRVKNFSFSQIHILQKLQHVHLTQCNVRNFDGINSLQNLTSIWIFHCSSLTSIEGLSKLPNLQKVWIASCSKLTDISELGQAKKLILLILENMKKCNLEFISDMQSLLIEGINLMHCGSIPNLQFIEKYPNLKTLGFWGTNILDGDLTPCLQLKFAHTANKRHYNLKDEQLPRDRNYILSKWF